MSAAYERYLEHMQGLHTLGSALSLLGWDQETMMPPAAVAHRADVRSHLSGLVHDGTVDPAFGDLLAELQESPLDDDQAANVRETVRDRDRSVKVPRELVTELSRVTSLAQQAWVDAREAEAKQFEDMFDEVVNPSVVNLKVDLPGIQTDESTIERNKQLVESVQKDVYIHEVLNILHDIIVLEGVATRD